MKTLFSCYTKAEAVEKVKALAAKADVPIGDLVGLLMEFGIEKLSVDKLRAWARAQPSRRGPLGGGLCKAERQVLRALDDLVAAERRNSSPAVRFGTDDVAAAAGLRIAVAYGALTALKQKGHVGMMTPPGPDGAPVLDRWGRATQGIWWKTEHLAEFDAKHSQG